MTYKNKQASEGKARGDVALITMYIHMEQHIIIITLLTKQTQNRCSAQLKTPMQTFFLFLFFPPLFKTSMTSKRTTDSSSRKNYLGKVKMASAQFTLVRGGRPIQNRHQLQ